MRKTCIRSVSSRCSQGSPLSESGVYRIALLQMAFNPAQRCQWRNCCTVRWKKRLGFHLPVKLSHARRDAGSQQLPFPQEKPTPPLGPRPSGRVNRGVFHCTSCPGDLTLQSSAQAGGRLPHRDPLTVRRFIQRPRSPALWGVPLYRKLWITTVSVTQECSFQINVSLCIYR